MYLASYSLENSSPHSKDQKAQDHCVQAQRRDKDEAPPSSPNVSSLHFVCELPCNLVVAPQFPFLPICSELEMGSGGQRDHVCTIQCISQ